MTGQQTLWLYNRLKKLFGSVNGKIPSEDDINKLFEEIKYIEDVTAKSRQEDAELDKWVNDMGVITLSIWHASTKWGKQL